MIMTHLSISKLKANPSKAIKLAADYPVAIENRNQTQAYLVGKALYERLVSYMEDQQDRLDVEATDFSKGKNLEDVVKNLGL